MAILLGWYNNHKAEVQNENAKQDTKKQNMDVTHLRESKRSIHVSVGWKSKKTRVLYRLRSIISSRY